MDSSNYNATPCVPRGAIICVNFTGEVESRTLKYCGQEIFVSLGNISRPFVSDNLFLTRS
jgi:hypothetical protein